MATKIASIVLPTYNEKDNIEKAVSTILAQESKLSGWKFEIIIADSDSPDGTGEVAQKLVKQNKRVHYIKVERGIGFGIIKGHQYALEHIKPDVLVQMDADMQVEPEIVPNLIRAIEQGYNLALGSRFVEGGQNQLSFSRRLFSAGSSVVCRILMGPWNIKEFTNSARAFTPELFSRINLKRLPWKEKTFIIQPAFLNEAILAGANYKEVPLIFKNRAEGYSKNKVVNYTYDVVTYALDARFQKLGLPISVFYITRRAKTLIKFGLVGAIGTLVDFAFYNLFISQFGIPPATSKAISTEIAIINNFIFNNSWTFKYRKTKSSLLKRMFTFNLVSLGGLAIGVVVVKFLDIVYGAGYATVLGLDVPYYNLYFFAAIPPVLIWNFTVNHFVTWKNRED